MKRRKLVALAIAVLMIMLIPATAFAATHEDVDTWDKLQAAFADTDADVTIILTGDITTLGALQAGEGQTYVINGQEYVLKDVRLVGAGEVEINAGIQNEDEQQALQVKEHVQLTVNGNVDSAAGGVQVNDFAKVEVNGDVTGAGSGDGVDAYGYGEVTVKGNVTGGGNGVDAGGAAKVQVEGDVVGGTDGDGVNAKDFSKIDVNGDVTGGTATQPFSDMNTGVKATVEAEVTVKGNVTGGDAASDVTNANGGVGVKTDEKASVKVEGNVTGGNGNADAANSGLSGQQHSNGGEGVWAHGESKVEVSGNVQGGDAQGNNGIAGDGVKATGHSQVKVDGNTQGGDVLADSAQADPDEPEYLHSRGGNGVEMSYTADVTVGGNAIGGNSQGDQGRAGNGVIVCSFTMSDLPYDAPERAPGKLVIYGTVQGGQADNGKDGNGIKYVFGEEGDIGDLPLFMEINPDVPFDANFIKYNCSSYIANTLMTFGHYEWEKIEGELDQFEVTLAQLCTQAFGKPYDLNTLDEDLAALSAEEKLILQQAVIDAVNDIIRPLFVEHKDELRPEITVWQVKGGGDAERFGANSNGEEFFAALLGADTNYIIRVAAPENGELLVQQTAKAGETVTVTALPKAGYTLGKVLLNGEELTGKDGVYSFVMPEGGGVELSAEFIADAPAEAPTNTAGSPKTGDNFSAALLMGLMAVSAMAVVVVRRKARTGK